MALTFHCRVYRSGRETVVAACDAELVGRDLREGKLRLRVSEAFYGNGDDAIESQQLTNHLRICTIANLVGERAVGLAVEHGLVAPERVLWIQGVPHAQLATL